MMDALIEATMKAPNGTLVFDFVASDEEKAALLAPWDQSTPRPLDHLLAYGTLAASAPPPPADTAAGEGGRGGAEEGGKEMGEEEEAAAFAEASSWAGSAEELAAAPAFASEAWALAARNPYVLHGQRVEVAAHVAEQLGDIERGNRSYLEHALTPPDDYMG